MKIRFWLMGLILSWGFFAFLTGCASLPVSPPGTKPIITHAYCAKKGNFGDPIRIYLDAEDPRGYMFQIITVVDQVGYGEYFPDTIYVSSQDQHRLKGYIQWNTANAHTSYMPEWTQLLIRVSIYDTDDDRSNVVVFPVEFVSEEIRQPPLPSPFNEGELPRLGYVDIMLFNPFDMGHLMRDDDPKLTGP